MFAPVGTHPDEDERTRRGESGERLQQDTLLFADLLEQFVRAGQPAAAHRQREQRVRAENRNVEGQFDRLVRLRGGDGRGSVARVTLVTLRLEEATITIADQRRLVEKRRGQRRRRGQGQVRIAELRRVQGRVRAGDRHLHVGRGRLKVQPGLQGDAGVGLVFGTIDHVDQPTRRTPDIVQILLTRGELSQPATGLVRLVDREGFALTLLGADQLEVQPDRHVTVLRDEAIVVAQVLH